MDFSKLLDIGYLLEIQPPTEFPLFWVFVTVFGALILVGIAFLLFIKLNKGDSLFARATRIVPAKAIGYGLGGFLFLFFRTQRAPYLSMRLWLFLYLLWILYVIYSTSRQVSYDYKSRISMRRERENIKGDTYLPQQKRGK